MRPGVLLFSWGFFDSRPLSFGAERSTLLAVLRLAMAELHLALHSAHAGGCSCAAQPVAVSLAHAGGCR